MKKRKTYIQNGPYNIETIKHVSFLSSSVSSRHSADSQSLAWKNDESLAALCRSAVKRVEKAYTPCHGYACIKYSILDLYNDKDNLCTFIMYIHIVCIYIYIYSICVYIDIYIVMSCNYIRIYHIHIII